jgi:S1-C subfamily serine protease
LKDRDKIESIDGRGVSSIDQVQAIVAARRPGDALSLRVRRGNNTLTLKARLGSRPAQAPQ